MHPRSTRIVCAALSLCGAPACERDAPDAGPALPEVRARSRYIEYATWADDAALCMDWTLARMDEFLEETAAYLEVDPPAPGSVRYVWVPEELQTEDVWGCRNATPGFPDGCYRSMDEGGLIYTEQVPHPHELVHAVDIAALGAPHVLLAEGLAEHLGSSTRHADGLPGFAAGFEALVRGGERPRDYTLPMHFVGALLDEGGVDAFKQLRAAVPGDASWDEFAAAYQDVYGEPLPAALARMETRTVVGRLAPPCAGEELAWTDPVALTATLRGRCGDPGFVGAGGVDGTPAFRKSFVLDIAEAGYYRIVLTGLDPGLDPGTPVAALSGCAGVDSELVVATAQGGSLGRLEPGAHQLTVAFTRADGEERYDLALEYAPLPP